MNAKRKYELIILAIVWFFHVVYFIFGIKTLKDNEEEIENI